jgi:hypothetical protein
MLRAVSGGGSSTPGIGWVVSNGPPSDADGNPDGTLALDSSSTTQAYYKKVSGTYGVNTVGPIGTLQGAGAGQTAASSVILGSGAPDPTVGSAGQMYVDQASKLVYLPKGVASITPVGFFGVNIHIGYTSSFWPNMTVTSYLALFAQMGIQTVRTNIASVAKANNVLSTVKGLIAGGIDVLVVIDASPNLGSTFAAQQSAASTLGASLATALMGSGVKYIETSNEFDFNCKINGANPRGFVADGGSYDDFTSSKFECWRGWTSGMLSGIRGVTSEFKLGYASGVAFPQTAFRMLREGRDTTGAVTQTPLSFDFLGAHFYDTQGNPTSFTCKSRTGSSVATNSLAELRGLTGNATYDVPQTPAFELMVTEWGSRAADTNQGAFYAQRTLDFFNWKSTYNIKAIYAYALFADTTDAGTGPVFGVNALNFGLIQADGSTKKPAYNSFCNVIQSNTVTTPGGWPAIARALPLPVYSSGAQVLSPLTVTDNVLKSFTIPGGSMGPNTTMRITAIFTMPNNANTKTFRIRFGGVVIYQASFTTAVTLNMEFLIQNRGVLNAQIAQVQSMLGPTSNTGPVLTAAVDTTADQVVAFSAQAGVGTDQLALERCSIELIG